MDDRIEAWRHGLLRLVLQHARAYADNSDPAKTEAAYVAICDCLRTTPEGFALVPIEPTDDMLVAGQEAWVIIKASRAAIDDCQHADATYRAMLAASQESGT